MPNNIEYSAEKELTQFVDDLINDPRYSELAGLRENKIRVLACFSIRTGDDGETQPCKGEPISLKKVSDVERIFVKDKAQFILVVDYHAWEQWNEKLRTACIYHHLVSLDVQKGEHGIKIKRVKCPVQVHTQEAARFGAYSQPLLELVEALKDKSRRADWLIEAIDTAESTTEPVEESPEEPADAEQPHVRSADEIAAEAEDELPAPKPSLPKKGVKK